MLDMRDRLIDILLHKPNKLTFEQLGDYLLANGVILPPCKVGDTVYEFFDVKGFYDISELIVENIVVGVNPSKCVLYTRTKQSGSRDRFFDDSFGRILFFTREEAEKALRYMC